MRYRDLLIVWSLLLATSAPPVLAEDRPETIRVPDAPRTVQERIRRESPTTDAQVTIERVHRNGQTLYEVEMTDGYREVEILVDEDGRLVPQHHDPD